MGGLLFDFLCTYEKNVKLLLESAVGDISFQKYIIVYNDPEIKKKFLDLELYGCANELVGINWLCGVCDLHGPWIILNSSSIYLLQLSNLELIVRPFNMLKSWSNCTLLGVIVAHNETINLSILLFVSYVEENFLHELFSDHVWTHNHTGRLENIFSESQAFINIIISYISVWWFKVERFKS